MKWRIKTLFTLQQYYECLNTNWFLSLLDAKHIIEQWRRDYNEFRPHSSLNDLTPNEVHSEQNISPISLLLTGTG